MTTIVPSLSARGWASNISDKADLLMSYYFSTDYLQSVMWLGTVTSFQRTLEEHHHRPDKLREMLEMQLEDYLSRYFEAVEIQVKMTTPDHNKPNELMIEFSVKVQQDGQTYSLGRVIQTIDSTIQKMFDINNG